MNRIWELHDEAMQQAMKAELAKLTGDDERVRNYLIEAYELEKTAAQLLSESLVDEPTRSVLFRSAASLGLECGKFREAEQLACTGLSGNPPEEIAEELRDVVERINFHRHLALRGQVLSENELQMSLAGDDVMSGLANLETATERANNTAKLILRTAQRKSGQPYKDKISKSLREKLYMTIPRAASFAFTIRFSRERDQPALPGLGDEADIVNEFFTCTEFVTQNKFELLRNRINNDAYFRNFMSLTEKIAPDGQNIKMVGFTSILEGKTREVNMVIPRSEIKTIIENEEKVAEPRAETISLRGKLLFANAAGQENKIKIVDETKTKHTVIVPEGLMDDIVRPLWNRQVVVEGSKKGKTTTLLDINPIDD